MECVHACVHECVVDYNQLSFIIIPTNIVHQQSTCVTTNLYLVKGKLTGCLHGYSLVPVLFYQANPISS